MEFSSKDILVPAAFVFLHQLEGETVLISAVEESEADNAAVLKLNDTALAVWELLDGKRDLQALLHAMTGRFSAPEAVIRVDIEIFLRALLQRRLIIKASPASL